MFVRRTLLTAVLLAGARLAYAQTADIALSASGPSSAVPGNTATYALSVMNGGPSAATGVTVSFQLPNGVSYRSSGTGWSCSGSSSVTCTYTITVASGGSAPTLNVTLLLSSSLTGSLSLTFTASSNLSDTNTANNSQTVNTTLSPSADLYLSASGPSSVTAGGTASYTVSASNVGPSTATGMTVSFPLPTGVTYSSVSGSGWSCSQAGSNVTCSQSSSVVPGGSAPNLGVTLAVGSSVSGSMAVTFTVASSASDPISANNSATVPSTVTPSNLVWLLNNNGTLTKMSQAGAVIANAETAGATSVLGGVAIDASSNVWSVSAGTNQVVSTSVTGSPSSAYTGGSLNAPAALAVDGAGSVWVANSGSGSVSQFLSSGTAQTTQYAFPAIASQAASALSGNPAAIAVDASGGLWVVNQGGNSVTHIFGLAVPVVTPLSIAVTNGTVATKP